MRLSRLAAGWGLQRMASSSTHVVRRARLVQAQAATGARAKRRPGAGAPPPSKAKPLPERARQLSELIEETIKVSMSTGPRGLTRAVQAASAVVGLAQEYAVSGKLDEPQVVLRKLFERLGATWIKLGQFIASTPSVFPDEYVTEFTKCLDSTPPVPFSVIQKTLQQELQRPVDEIFSFIDPTPLASASVAQVHAAVLRSSKQEVVIKVLKPDVEDTLTADLNFVYLATRFLEFLTPELSRLSAAAVLSDIRDSMMDEVDFTKELVHLQHFSNFLDSRGFRQDLTECAAHHRT